MSGNRSRKTTLKNAGRPGERAVRMDTRQRIADRAYAIFIERGRPHGSDLEHWLEAERQVLLESGRARAPVKKPSPAA